jgi:hypothetical protein
MNIRIHLLQSVIKNTWMISLFIDTISPILRSFNLEKIVEYITMDHDVTQHDGKDAEDFLPSGLSLVAYKSNHRHDTSHGKIQDILVVFKTTSKIKFINAHKCNYVPSTFQFG